MAKKVNRPFEGCSKYFRVRTSFATHISRKHKQSFVAQPPPRYPDTQIQVEDNQVQDDQDEMTDASLDDNNPDMYLKNVALFYLKLQAKLLLPATTVQCIVEEFQEAHSSGMKHVLKKVEERLKGLNITYDEIQKIVTGLEQEDLLTIYNKGILRSDRTRKTYFKEKFEYVAPVQMYLGTDKTGKERFCQTPANYNDSVQQLTPEHNIIDGIKFDSCFNSLKSFHVCSGLPLCLGHDLFEGVVANDLALYIEHLKKVEKQFTYDQINWAISQTKLLGSDSHNKPCEIKEKAKKLSGSATQNWCLLRLLPLYVSQWIKNPIDSMEAECIQELRKVIPELEMDTDQPIILSTIPDEQTALFSSLDTQLTPTPTPPRTQSHSSRFPSTKPQNAWIRQFEIPWNKMPASLLKATLRGQRARPEDRRAWKRTVVSAMQEHCPNPNKAACDEIAKMIMSKYPSTFADMTEEDEQLGVGYYSLVKQLKARVEHANRNNVSEKIRRPRIMSQTSDDGSTKTVWCKVDSYGCINWQPKCVPEGETSKSLEDRRKDIMAIFQSAGPRAVDRPDVDESIRLTSISVTC
ncbi:hypothetical protein ABVT39_013489 [Epinephelus coioides]